MSKRTIIQLKHFLRPRLHFVLFRRTYLTSLAFFQGPWHQIALLTKNSDEPGLQLFELRVLTHTVYG